MSKSGSSIQYGWSRPSGTFSSLRRRTGTSGMRSDRTSVRRARVSGLGAPLGSSIDSPPTWPVVVAVSRARKEASSPVSCCMVHSLGVGDPPDEVDHCLLRSLGHDLGTVVIRPILDLSTLLWNMDFLRWSGT